MIKPFECQMCGRCCYGEGGIHVEGQEIKRIARFLSVTEEAFIAQYCVQRHGRLSIRTGPGTFCVFYDATKKCTIHPVKPRPCAMWPFYPAIVEDMDNWKIAKEACPGINPECSFEEFVEQSRE